MKFKITTLILTLVYFISKTNCKNNETFDKFKISQINVKKLNISELKLLLKLVNDYDAWRKEEDEKRKQTLENNRKSQKEEDMRRQRVIQAHLGPVSGRTSVLKDFFSNRIIK
jgi:hypothetical protein